jgi:cytochrome c
MKQLVLLCVFGLTLTSPALYASQELADKNGCTGCHLIDRKTVGPAIRQIAQKYAGQQEAAVTLFEKVKNGGGGGGHGNWGQVPMPPNPQVSDEDLKIILKWMLNQK